MDVTEDLLMERLRRLGRINLLNQKAQLERHPHRSQSDDLHTCECDRY